MRNAGSKVWAIASLGAALAFLAWGISGTSTKAGQAPPARSTAGSLAGPLPGATSELNDTRFVPTALSTDHHSAGGPDR